MMVKKYISFEEINKDLKAYSLQREIAWEELKYSKEEFKESLAPYQWINTTFTAVKRYGVLYLVKKLLR